MICVHCKAPEVAGGAKGLGRSMTPQRQRQGGPARPDHVPQCLRRHAGEGGGHPGHRGHQTPAAATEASDSAMSDVAPGISVEIMTMGKNFRPGLQVVEKAWNPFADKSTAKNPKAIICIYHVAIKLVILGTLDVQAGIYLCFYV